MKLDKMMKTQTPDLRYSQTKLKEFFTYFNAIETEMFHDKNYMFFLLEEKRIIILAKSLPLSIN